MSSNARSSQIYPCGRFARRDFIHQIGGGFLGLALGAVWAEADELQETVAALPKAAKAKSVIFLFMCGGVSHIDTFDPKDNKWAGKFIDAVGFGDNLAAMKRPVIPCLRTFTRYGQSGTPVSDWFPHVGSVIDEIAVVRSMWCHEGNHFPAVIETQTGHRGRAFDHPTFGSWVSYALGSANKNLPTFVNLGRPSSPVQLTGGYLGASVAATPFQAGETPIPNLDPPKSTSGAERERQMEWLHTMNQEFRERYAINSDIQARAKAYELAARMQLSAPDAVNFSGEPDHVKALYGIGEKGDGRFRQTACSLARRAQAERGVRIQVSSATPAAAMAWHGIRMAT